ncbi:MAG: hypothetical protein ABL903_16185 [Methylococcales bacterium]
MELKPNDSERFTSETLIQSSKRPKKPSFPDARYFQIHFEFMETQLFETQRKLEQMQQQIIDMHDSFVKNSPELVSLPNVRRNKIVK